MDPLLVAALPKREVWGLPGAGCDQIDVIQRNQVFQKIEGESWFGLNYVKLLSKHVLKNQKVDKACEKFIILRYVTWPDMLSSFVVKVWSPRLVYNKFLLQGSSTNSTACAGGIQMWLLCDLPGGGAGKLMKIGGYFHWHVLIFGKLEVIFHSPVLIYVHGPLNFGAKNSDETQSKPQRSRVAPKGLLDQNGWAWKNRLSKSGKRWSIIFHDLTSTLT